MRRPLLNWTLAIAALVAAVALRWLLEPLMAGSLPLVTLFGAVAGAVWVGGWRPAVFVGILGYAACSYLFVHVVKHSQNFLRTSDIRLPKGGHRRFVSLVMLRRNHNEPIRGQMFRQPRIGRAS